MILESMTTALFKVLTDYQNKNKDKKIIFPPPGEEDKAILETFLNPDTRKKEVYQILKAIRAKYLPFSVYIANIEVAVNSIYVGTLTRGSELKKDMLAALALVKKEPLEKILESEINRLKTKFPITGFDRNFNIMEYCSALNEFHTLHHRFKAKLTTTDNPIETEYGIYMHMEEYLNKFPHDYEGETEYLELEKKILKAKIEVITRTVPPDLATSEPDLETDLINAETLARTSHHKSEKSQRDTLVTAHSVALKEKNSELKQLKTELTEKVAALILQVEEQQGQNKELKTELDTRLQQHAELARNIVSAPERILKLEEELRATRDEIAKLNASHRDEIEKLTTSHKDDHDTALKNAEAAGQVGILLKEKTSLEARLQHAQDRISALTAAHHHPTPAFAPTPAAPKDYVHQGHDHPNNRGGGGKHQKGHRPS